MRSSDSKDSARRRRFIAGRSREKPARRDHLQLLSFDRGEARVPVAGSGDITIARKTGWQFAMRLGFSPTEATLIAAITSELARMIIHSSQQGEIVFSVLENGMRRGLEVVARRREAGRAAPEAAETSQRRQLAGVGKLVDEFTIVSEQGGGTTVTVKKWML